MSLIVYIPGELLDMDKRTFQSGVDIALVGEIDARRELAAEGWLTINTNTEKGNFPNVDLLAVKGEEVRSIQVKTTKSEKGSHKDYLFMGRAQGWLEDKTPFFNAKDGPLEASIVVLVHASRCQSRYVVLPVGLAEHLARYDVEYYYTVLKKNGEQRSAGFDARLPFTVVRKNPRPTDDYCREMLLAFENRWDILDAPLDKLKDYSEWI